MLFFFLRELTEGVGLFSDMTGVKGHGATILFGIPGTPAKPGLDLIEIVYNYMKTMQLHMTYRRLKRGSNRLWTRSYVRNL